MSDRLNLLDILNSRLLHEQTSTVSTDTLNIPRTFHGQVTDGIHETTYGYLNINRVFHELISNAQKAIYEIDRKSVLGHLSQYISGEDKLSRTDDNLQKLIIGPTGTVTNTQFLKIVDYTIGIITDIDRIKASFIVDKNNIVIVTETELLAYNINTHKKTVLREFVDGETIVNSRMLIPCESFQINTDKQIIQYKIINLDTEDALTESNLLLEETLAINFVQLYAGGKLHITDVARRFNNITDILSTNIRINWFDDFVPLTTQLFTPNPSAIANVTLQNVGIIVGQYGIFELIQQSSGDFFIRVIDNEAVNKTIIYKKDGFEWLIAFNDIGVKTYKILYDGVQMFNINIEELIDMDALEEIKFEWLSETGNIETFKNSGAFININGLLEYGFIPDPYDPTTLSHRIPGAVIGDIKYAYVDTLQDMPVILLKDEHKGQYRCIVVAESTGLARLVHDYDLSEFNGLKEVTVTDVAKFLHSEKHFMFAVKNVGIVRGEIKYDANNKAGMRLANIQKYPEDLNKSNNDVRFMPTSQAVFVYNNITNRFYVTATSSDELLEILIDNRFVPIDITYALDNTVFITDSKHQTVYRAQLQRHYSTTKHDLSTEITDVVLKKTNSKIYEKFNGHLNDMHSEDSAMTRLNNFIYRLKQTAKEDSTIFVSSSDIAYISTGFGLTNVERNVTDENSPHIYGRLNSRTLNSYIGMRTMAKRVSANILLYDTIYDLDNTEYSTNKLTYVAYKLSDNILKMEINVPTTFTYYVNNILGWSKGANSGATFARTNLNNGFLAGKLESIFTEYQLVLNREYFKILRVLNVNCQLASAPLKVYSDKKYFDSTHYAMFDSPIINPLCTTNLLSDNTFETKNNQNNEVFLDFAIFGGDALTINILLETDK